MCLCSNIPSIKNEIFKKYNTKRCKSSLTCNTLSTVYNYIVYTVSKMNTEHNIYYIDVLLLFRATASSYFHKFTSEKFPIIPKIFNLPLHKIKEST